MSVQKTHSIRACLVMMSIIAMTAIAPGSASASGPAWSIAAQANPTSFLPNSTTNQGLPNAVIVTARNLGSTPMNGAEVPIKIALNLQGVTATEISATSGGSCVQPAGPCTFTEVLRARQALSFTLRIKTGALGAASNTATVSGGVAGGVVVAPATVKQQLQISSSPAPFGIQPSSLVAEFADANDGPATQAGSHPYNFTVDLNFATTVQKLENPEIGAVQDVKDVAVELPPGLVGNQLAVGQCTGEALYNRECANSSQVGTMRVGITGGVILSTRWGVFNLVPESGHTNELGFEVAGAFAQHMPTSVRTGSDYGLTNISTTIPSLAGSLVSVEARLFGVPGDHSNDTQRVAPGNGNYTEGEGEEGPGGFPSSLPPTPFFTMPSECGKPSEIRVAVDSYAHPGRLDSSRSPDLSDPNWKVLSVPVPPMTGCEKLQSFAPHVTVAPDTTFADTPAGATVDVSVPQGEGLISPTTLATSTLQNTKVTLPAGMVINPGQANGLGACQTAQSGVGTTDRPSCPANSKVGTVQIETPLLPDKLEGSVYVMQSDPPNLKLLVAPSGDDVNIKLIGDVTLDKSTGQLTATFTGTPELPFTHFKLTFSGGAQAALMTPPSCGVYSTTADFTPWSAPATPDFLSADGFALTAGPGGSACQSPLPFNPSLIAGSTTDQAGGYTGFSLLLSRNDGEQRIGALQFKTPAGLLGMLSKIPLCAESQAAAGTCSADSQIGHTVVAAGAGPAPLYVPEPGQAPAPIYLTGPYKGAPFGLSIVVPVIAGPFNLGTVVVRAAISVDPTTSQLTISTDELPQILAGVPTDLRQIDAVIDRPGFMFNPTGCTPREFSGVAQSADGASAPISSHFQVGSCQALKFKPNFKVSTKGKTSRKSGASLDARVVYPTGPLGENQASSQSNIASVKVDLPKQLPSRLTTLQKACPAAQFEANPAGCSVGSRIGVVKAVTPVLPVPLTGPVFFVSHGGEAFPSLVAVLQGDGVRVDLKASTFISKAGITSSTFGQVPDVPISSFELYLSQGPNSALATNGDLCTSKLAMPTTFTAQNGAVIRQSTPIAVTGCPKAKKAVKHKKKVAKSNRGGKR